MATNPEQDEYLDEDERDDIAQRSIFSAGWFRALLVLTVLIVLWYTVMQRLVPQDLLGRVSSLDWVMTTAGVPLSFAIVGPAAAAFGARTVLVAAGILGGAIALAFMFVPGARDPERDGRLAEAAVQPT